MSIILAILILVAGYAAIAALLCYLWGWFCVFAKIGWYDSDFGMAALAFWPVGLPVILILIAAGMMISVMGWFYDQATTQAYKMRDKKNERS
jgi:hypothetical protein